MARTALTVQTAALAGNQLVTENAADAANGNYFVNDGKTVLVVSNEHGATSTTVSATVNTDRFGRTKTFSLAVAAGRVGFFGPFPPEMFNQTGGVVNVDFTSGSSVYCSPISLVNALV